jgi:ubiquinone/menaquinone biosynthesis C-methylase UbiE
MGKLSDLVFFRGHHVCPRWMCFTFDNWFRRLWQDPDEIVRSYIKAGDTILDVGPGIGFFTIPMAKIVGERGRVIAADIQQEMLEGIKKRAGRAGVAERITLQLVSGDLSVVGVRVDFILAFWMAHEVPDQQRFFTQLYSLLKDGGKFLVVEPKLHVGFSQFEALLHKAQTAGFRIAAHPAVSLSFAALLVRPLNR